jgi:signal transduction histidine kinase
VQSWVLVAIVTVLAIAIEIDDVRSGVEGVEALVEIPLDLVAFLALVVLARRHRQALALEHAAVEAEHNLNTRQKAFFANASHALRTPIAVARGHAEMALHDVAEPSVKVKVRVVLDELDRLTKTTDRILRMSVAGAIEAHRLHLVDLDELVHWTVERWRPTASRTWVAETRCGGRRILGSFADLSEALDALIDNALLATSDGDTITVRAEIEDDGFVLSVIDTGAGVEGDTDHLFAPFERGHQLSSGESRGTGLGLAVVRAIARSHGGEATMTSRPGAGTTVRIVLPHTFTPQDQPAPRAESITISP